MNRPTLLSVLIPAVLLAFASPTLAQDFPSKPVRIITHGGPGSGGPDVMARLVAEYLGRVWKQQVVVLNQPGAGGLIAARNAAIAQPDGYTLFLPTNTTYVILPEQRDSLPFDLDRDFTPIGFVSETPMMVAANPTVGVSNLPDLIALSKKRPGELFYSAGSRGAVPHLAGEMLRDETGADLTFVPYPNDKAGLTDVVAGRISAVVAAVGALAGTAQAGQIVPLAVTSDRRLPNFPDLPTAAETTPGFGATAWFLLSAPGATPVSIVQKINRDLNTVLANHELKKRLYNLGAFQRILTPTQTTDFIRIEQQKWRPLVRKLNLKS